MYQPQNIRALADFMNTYKGDPDFISKVNSFSQDGLTAVQIMIYFFARRKGKAAIADEESSYKTISLICTGLGKYPQFLSQSMTNAPKEEFNSLNRDPSKSEYTYTNSSFSGTDMVVYMTLPREVSDGTPIPIGELQTISYSIHREVVPVRALGAINPTGFSAGPQTIAGSMIFTVFDQNMVYTIQDHIQKYLRSQMNKSRYSQGILDLQKLSNYDSSNITSQYVNMSMMPEFNVLITARNEYTPGGFASTILIEGIVVVDEGQVMSIEDMITENTISFMARNIRPMRSEQRGGR